MVSITIPAATSNHTLELSDRFLGRNVFNKDIAFSTASSVVDLNVYADAIA
jgi:hypothetical protein